MEIKTGDVLFKTDNYHDLQALFFVETVTEDSDGSKYIGGIEYQYWHDGRVNVHKHKQHENSTIIRNFYPINDRRSKRWATRAFKMIFEAKSAY